ncbi:MAG: hypothetical protein K8R31_04060 [Bacteroidales bacterium]|nr:hypothetical protein [Bacteroidales bacterium]
MDFTFKIYINLLNYIIENEYEINSVLKGINNLHRKILILRHDVDRYPMNALKMAKLEHNLGINGTYYFRIIPSVYNEEIMTQIQDLGHEVSYHYEDLSLMKGDYKAAIKHFEFQINRFRKFAPTKTICRHGSPLSKWDNKKLWEKYNYKDFGVICDTEHDIDFNNVFYISDNGMGWNKTSTSVRDKVQSRFNIPIKNTNQLMELIKNNKLPDKIMLNAHPDTFFDFGFRWIMNYLMIKTKNIIKWFIVKLNIIK